MEQLKGCAAPRRAYVCRGAPHPRALPSVLIRATDCHLPRQLGLRLVHAAAALVLFSSGELFAPLCFALARFALLCFGWCALHLDARRTRNQRRRTGGRGHTGVRQGARSTSESDRARRMPPPLARARARASGPRCTGSHGAARERERRDARRGRGRTGRLVGGGGRGGSALPARREGGALWWG